MWWYFTLIVSVVFGVFTVLAEIYLRTRPMYKVAREMSNGPKLRWFWDDLQFTLSLNLENTFSHLRRFALTFKQSYRYYSFGIFHVHIIRAEDAEVEWNSSREYFLSPISFADNPLLRSAYGQKYLLPLSGTIHGTRTSRQRRIQMVSTTENPHTCLPLQHSATVFQNVPVELKKGL